MTLIRTTVDNVTFQGTVYPKNSVLLADDTFAMRKIRERAAVDMEKVALDLDDSGSPDKFGAIIPTSNTPTVLDVRDLEEVGDSQTGTTDFECVRAVVITNLSDSDTLLVGDTGSYGSDEIPLLGHVVLSVLPGQSIGVVNPNCWNSSSKHDITLDPDGNDIDVAIAICGQAD